MTSCKQNIGIIGGGFGVYGYSESLLQSGWKIHSLKRYLKSFTNRISPENLQYVSFHEEINQLIIESDFLVLALPPKEQEKALKKITSSSHLRHIFLEKPLACSPKMAMELVSFLSSNNVSFSVGYLMRHTQWYNNLRDLSINDKSEIKIRWDFKSHHFANNLKNWKSDPSEGGGALRFYGIHLIALAQDMGFTTVENASALNAYGFECSSFKSCLSRNDSSTFEFNVNSCANENIFQVIYNNKELANLRDPFNEEDDLLTNDRRLPYLERYIAENLQKTDYSSSWAKEKNICQLWAKIEECLPE